jgi:hypothetical protein
VCVGIGDGTGVCSEQCNASGDCLPGWSCGPFQGQSQNVCLCTKSTEICDGLDNDCNGIVDDRVPASADCSARNGRGLSVCEQGICTCTDRCGGTCTDLSRDPANCGACGKACPSDAACEAGTCACPGSTAACGSSCIDTTTDDNHCGDCDTKCPSDAVCQASLCLCPPGKSVCGHTCSDLSTDIANCGACGVSCAGTCRVGRCITTLASALQNPQDIAVDAANVYWTEGGSGKVMKVSTSGGTPSTVASNQSAVLSLAIDSQNAYWTAGGGVFQAPLSGGAPVTLSTTPGFDVTTDGTDVFFSSSAGVFSVPIGGGTATFLGGKEDDTTNPPLAVDADYVYYKTTFSDTGAEHLWQAPKAALGVSLFLSSSYCTDLLRTANYLFTAEGSLDRYTLPVQYGIVHTLLVTAAYALASDGAHVYFSATSDGTISKIPVEGGSVDVLARQQTAPTAIAVDATSVYWLNSGTTGSLMKVTPK